MVVKRENIQASTSVHREIDDGLSSTFSNLREYTNDEINKCRNDFERIIRKTSWQRRTKTRRRR